MSIFSGSNPLLTTITAAGGGGGGGYEIERSLRFNSSDSAYLSRTPASAGNRKTWTWAGWVKRSGVGSNHALFGAGQTGTAETVRAALQIVSDQINFFSDPTGSAGTTLQSTNVLRDASAWYHIVCSVDVTQATASDRVKIYVNGVQVTSFSTSNYPALNTDTAFNSTDEHRIGAYYNLGGIFSGYLADVHFIDGQALDPTSFGEFDDNGIWQPIEYTGDYGFVSVADATGALPIYNTTDTYGTVKGTGTRTDVNSASIELALPMEGANNGTTFTDESATIKGSGSPQTITRYGDTKTVTAQSKYYGSSGYFDGSGDYMSVGVYDTPGFLLGSQTFTIEAWVYRAATGASHYIVGKGNDNGYWIQVNSSNKLMWLQVNSSSSGYQTITDTVDFPQNKWVHVAAVSNGTTVTLYKDGISIGTCNVTTHDGNGQGPTGSTVALGIGDYYGGANRDTWNGYLQDVRIYKGVAKYTSNFSPVVSSNNSFHLPFSDNSTAAALGTDTSGNGNDWTVNNISAVERFFVDGIGSSIDVYIPAGWTRTSDPFNCLTNDQTGVLVNQDAKNYFKVTATSSTITVKWILYDGTGGSFNPTVTLSTSLGSGAVTPSVSGTGSTSNPSVGTYTVTPGVEYFVRTGLVGVGNPALVVYVTGADIAVIDYANPDTDSLVDVPTNGTEEDTGVGGEVRGNYCTFNPLTGSYDSLTNGNLNVRTKQVGTPAVVSTFAVSSGKWYAEFTINGKSATNTTAGIGIVKAGDDISSFIGNFSGGYIYYSDNSSSYKENNNVPLSYGANFTTGDTIGVALDLDAGTLVFYKNGSSQGTAYSSLSGQFYFAVSDGNNNDWVDFVANFGQRPFAYTAPSGFKALCTANLDAPVVTKPSEYMDVALYTGNGGTQSISGLEFSPDFVWIKNRTDSAAHRLLDTIRGATKVLYSDFTDAETTESTSLTAFNSDGFAVGSENGVNGLNDAIVAWTWDAGSSTVSNTDGSITSSVRANPSAGFSIVTWSVGTAVNNSTIGHGLGGPPSFIICKTRTASNQNWIVYHKTLGTGDYLALENTQGSDTRYPTIWGTSAPTSTVFGVGTTGLSNNTSSNDYVAYCFAPVDGYSAFGSFVGNNSADGPFVFTGHRPRFIMWKASSTTGNWIIMDANRSPYNAANDYLLPNTSDAEGTLGAVDFLSNGFKLNSAAFNGASTYIYAAFAENPFALNARAR